MRKMNFKERMIYLTDLTAENANDLEKKTNGTVIEDAQGNIKVIFDMRTILKNKLEEYNIKESQISNFLGITKQQKWHYLSGSHGISYDKAEKLFFLLFGEILTDED